MIRFSRSAFFCAAALTGALSGWLVSAWTRAPESTAGDSAVNGLDASPQAPVVVAGTGAPSPALALVLPELSTAGECRARLEALETPAPGRHPMIVRAERNFLLRRWLELDAESALAEAERRLDPEFSGGLFRVWLEMDVDSAREAFSQASPAVTKSVRDKFLTALADKNPALAVEEMTSPRWRGPEKRNDWVLRAAYEKWARLDPRAAFHHAENSPLKFSPPLEVSTVRSWLEGSPAEALSFFEERMAKEKADYRKGVAEAFLAAALGGDLPADSGIMRRIRSLILAESMELPDGEKGDLAYWAASQNPRAALEWAKELPEGSALRGEMMTQAAAEFAASDPERALEWLRETSGAEQAGAVNSVLLNAFASLGAQDSGRALGLLGQLPEAQKPHAMSGWLTQAFKNDPAAAVDQCREWLADPVMREHLTTGRAWARVFTWSSEAELRDPGPVLEALPELASAVNGMVLETWAREKPEAAAEWIAQNAGDGNYTSRPLGEGAIAEITHSRPEFAAGWIERLPAGSPLQKWAAHSLAVNWGAFDPDAAQAWVRSLPPLLREGLNK